MAENDSFLRKIPPAVFLILLLAVPLQNNAQLVKRQCISCYGASVLTGSTGFGLTVGQPFSTVVTGDYSGYFFPGFQQPAVFRTENLNSTDSETLQLTICPNPAARSVIILSPEQADNMTIKVMDSNGKLVMSDNKASLQNYTINCSKWEDGIYLVTVYDRRQLRNSMKLIIKK